PAAVVFAAIGDYGQAGDGAAAVATLVSSWEPEFIITLGDNNYPDGEAETIDENIGQYYADYIYPYLGEYPTTSTLEINRFFPALGNHDYYNPDGAQPYLEYFTLPGNERYYDFTWGPVHLFALNSDFSEPDGVGANSAQAQWLQEALSESTASWKLVYFHVTPYSSSDRDSGAWMRWPFREWGASAVLAAHEHHYERLLVDGLPYFVNGLGGGAIYSIGEVHPDSQVQFTGTHGAMRIEASPETITLEFITRSGEVIDSHTLHK
ncbi:MAG TPA: metallophosphoesterase, partial [Candidatus Sulfomarinibacteraceae bacterium]|nr:metallophosphoesterase [Candidatus Sulfomarinibacteraceae bacterium]